MGWVSAAPKEEANTKSDKHMGHIDSTTGRAACEPGGPCKIPIQSLAISTCPRYEKIPPSPAFVYCFCLSCFAPHFVQAVIPRLALATLSCLSAGQMDAGVCGTATASRPGGAAMVELLLKKITC